MGEALVPAVHQVREVVADAPLGTRPRALHPREEGQGQTKGRKAEGEGEDNRKHAFLGSSRRRSGFIKRVLIALYAIEAFTRAASGNERKKRNVGDSQVQNLEFKLLFKQKHHVCS